MFFGQVLLMSVLLMSVFFNCKLKVERPMCSLSLVN